MHLRALRRAGATALGVMLASSLFGVLISARTTPGEQTWQQMLRMNLAFAYAWGALCLLVIAVDRRVLLRGPTLAASLLWHLPASLLVCALSAYLVPAVSLLLSSPSEHGFVLSLAPLRQALRWGIAGQLILYGAIVGAHRAVHYYARYQERTVRTVELEKLLAQSQLQALRMQLEPHFLFNALNTISAQVESEPRAARRMIEELGELLRCSLESHDQQEVPLSQELALLNRYLAIQHARFEDRLQVAIDVPAETLAARVPSQLLQPLVENALRHGLGPRASGGRLRIEAAHEGAALRLRVADDGVGLPSGRVADGRGLSITRRRLAALYSNGQAHIEIRNGSPVGAVVEITLPWRAEPLASARSGHGQDTHADAFGHRR